MLRLALALAAVATAASAGGAPATKLTIDVWPQGRTVATGHVHYTLRCSPAAGTVPRPGNACAVLARLAHPFAATAPATACPSLVLGPQEAHVVGTVRGTRVNAWLNLAHCGVARWNLVKAIVPEPKLTGHTPPPVTPPAERRDHRHDAERTASGSRLDQPRQRPRRHGRHRHRDEPRRDRRRPAGPRPHGADERLRHPGRLHRAARRDDRRRQGLQPQRRGHERRHVHGHRLSEIPRISLTVLSFGDRIGSRSNDFS